MKILQLYLLYYLKSCISKLSKLTLDILVISVSETKDLPTTLSTLLLKEVTFKVIKISYS
jgi:hypothetical protein